ncbi:sulfite exporter TauE/SafE family protein [Fusobacterium sp.]|uniref:sulfite exporter TauE/SafE family protein n=1 Tax=Fusobacterium sp. TaxID=68766 RepID=UPI0029049277|nr:sulfite exporter TauE/SafE family protein [Fusobacterium sp.]MDU1911431.1 sulfite exporter TauE/SafE family protein [Fusobacterium sp.]
MTSIEIFGMIILGIGTGFSKLGIPTALIFSPLLASLYGGKTSAGIIIIPVVISDLTMLYLYGKELDLKTLKKILPMTVLGMIVAVIFGNNISDEFFKKSMGIIILTIGILTLLKSLNVNFSKLSHIFGFLGGFSSFIGNVSGPLMSIYLLNIDLDKEKFYGTRTWFYFIVNFSKFLLYFFFLKNINLFTLSRGVFAIPTTFIGIFIARFIVGKMNQSIFEKFIVIISVISGLNLLLN